MTFNNPRQTKCSLGGRQHPDNSVSKRRDNMTKDNNTQFTNP